MKVDQSRCLRLYASLVTTINYYLNYLNYIQRKQPERKREKEREAGKERERERRMTRREKVGLEQFSNLLQAQGRKSLQVVSEMCSESTFQTGISGLRHERVGPGGKSAFPV